jgi:hypothetical protein
MRQAVSSMLTRSRTQIGDISTPFDLDRYFRQQLLDEHQLDVVISAKSLELTLIGAQQPVIQITDETIAIDDEDFSSVTIDQHWLDAMLARIEGIASAYRDVDMTHSPMAQLEALPADAQRQVVEVYRHATDHFRRGGNGQLNLHLTLPTDYWTADFFASDPDGNRLVIADDVRFTEMLEALPPACEIIGEEGSTTNLAFIPLYLKTVRIG